MLRSRQDVEGLALLITLALSGASTASAQESISVTFCPDEVGTTKTVTYTPTAEVDDHLVADVLIFGFESGSCCTPSFGNAFGTVKVRHENEEAVLPSQGFGLAPRDQVDVPDFDDLPADSPWELEVALESSACQSLTCVECGGASILFSMVIQTATNCDSDINTQVHQPVVLAGGGASNEHIGFLEANGGYMSCVTGVFYFADEFVQLDNCYDFRWLSVLKSASVAGVPQAVIPAHDNLPALTLPGIDTSDYSAAFYRPNEQWEAGEVSISLSSMPFCQPTQVIHDQGYFSKFFDDPFSPFTDTVWTFETYLVAYVKTPGNKTVHPLTGFEWRYTNITGGHDGGVCKQVSPDYGLIATAIANSPSLSGWSAAPLPGGLDACQPLTASVGQVSLSAGGTQALELNAGPNLAGEIYWVLGSASGTMPGIPGATPVPLNFDAYTLVTIQYPNTLVANGFNLLDASGSATAAFTLTPGSDPSLAGAHLDHAFLVVDYVGLIPTVPFASNAVGVDLIL